MYKAKDDEPFGKADKLEEMEERYETEELKEYYDDRECSGVDAEQAVAFARYSTPLPPHTRPTATPEL